MPLRRCVRQYPKTKAVHCHLCGSQCLLDAYWVLEGQSDQGILFRVRKPTSADPREMWQSGFSLANQTVMLQDCQAVVLKESLPRRTQSSTVLIFQSLREENFRVDHGASRLRSRAEHHMAPLLTLSDVLDQKVRAALNKLDSHYPDSSFKSLYIPTPCKKCWT